MSGQGFEKSGRLFIFPNTRLLPFSLPRGESKRRLPAVICPVFPPWLRQSGARTFQPMSTRFALASITAGSLLSVSRRRTLTRPLFADPALGVGSFGVFACANSPHFALKFTSVNLRNFPSFGGKLRSWTSLALLCRVQIRPFDGRILLIQVSGFLAEIIKIITQKAGNVPPCKF